MTTTRTDTLKVPGAGLHYEVRGSGPVLLLICPGIMDAAGYGGLAAALSDQYTVVTYDRRGNSRSALDGPPDQQRIEVHADDAHRLLAAIGTEPAYVFGNSSGAVIGLDLAARHPEQVRTVVAHEPIAFELLPDSARLSALFEEVNDIYLKEGVGPAMERFGAGMGMDGDPGPDEAGPDEPGADEPGAAEPEFQPSPEMMAAMARMQDNMEFFIAYEVPPFSRHVPDIEALRAGSARVVVGAGNASDGEPPHRAALAVAERLGITAVEFPGGHGGFGTDSDVFAETLRTALRDG
jgi:pimeloyl-ACP methyl ester carboxylesterase